MADGESWWGGGVAVMRACSALDNSRQYRHQILSSRIRTILPFLRKLEFSAAKNNNGGPCTRRITPHQVNFQKKIRVRIRIEKTAKQKEATSRKKGKPNGFSRSASSGVVALAYVYCCRRPSH